MITKEMENVFEGTLLTVDNLGQEFLLTLPLSGPVFTDDKDLVEAFKVWSKQKYGEIRTHENLLKTEIIKNMKVTAFII